LKHGVTYSVDGVELPCGHEVLESERVDVLVDGQSDLNPEVHDHESLGANLVGQDLDGVRDEKTRPGKRVGNGEDPDHGDDSAAGSLASGGLLAGRANGPDNEGDHHTSGGGDEERAATNTIDQQSAGDRDDERKHGKTTVDAELSVRICYADGVVDVGGVVGDETVAGPLREQTERNEEQEPVPVALGLEEIKIGGRLLELELETEGLLDLSVLELDSGVVEVTVGVVLCEHLESLLVPLLGDQPSW
jgi:hypothetical protein